MEVLNIADADCFVNRGPSGLAHTSPPGRSNARGVRRSCRSMIDRRAAAIRNLKSGVSSTPRAVPRVNAVRLGATIWLLRPGICQHSRRSPNALESDHRRCRRVPRRRRRRLLTHPGPRLHRPDSAHLRSRLSRRGDESVSRGGGRARPQAAAPVGRRDVYRERSGDEGGRRLLEDRRRASATTSTTSPIRNSARSRSWARCRKPARRCC